MQRGARAHRERERDAENVVFQGHSVNKLGRGLDVVVFFCCSFFLNCFAFIFAIVSTMPYGQFLYYLQKKITVSYKMAAVVVLQLVMQKQLLEVDVSLK
jgi:hypothetical protein